MSSERKVAVITGASQGMGAALVEAYRDRDYAPSIMIGEKAAAMIIEAAARPAAPIAVSQPLTAA